MAKGAANCRTSGQVVGEALRRLRLQRRLTQEQIVAMARSEGLAWTVDTLGLLEAGRREDVTVSELAAMTQAFGNLFGIHHAWDWYSGEGDMRLNQHTTLNRAAMRVLLGSSSRADKLAAGPITSDYTSADWPTVRASLTGLMVLQSSTEAELHAAKVLRAPASTIKRLAMDLWGRRLDLERERRLGKFDQLEPSERRARRGHITRGLLAEMADALPKEAQ